METIAIVIVIFFALQSNQEDCFVVCDDCVVACQEDINEEKD